jgi:hypothetical protein
MAEDRVVDAVVKNLSWLGYAGAQCIREGQLLGGSPDLILLPQKGRENKKRLVLIEAEGERDAAEGAEAVGQLLKYYAYALKIGEQGLSLLAKRAELHADYFASKQHKSRADLTGAKNQEEAEKLLRDGDVIKPSEIALVLAFRTIKPKLAERLDVTTTALKEKHQLEIVVIEANERGVKHLTDLLHVRR